MTIVHINLKNIILFDLYTYTRDFGAFIYHWSEVFSVHNYLFWIPIIGAQPEF
jgi:hypothetical protein